MTGVLRQADGTPYPKDTKIVIWGEVVTLGEGGTFVSPLLPEDIVEALLSLLPSNVDDTQTTTVPASSTVTVSTNPSDVPIQIDVTVTSPGGAGAGGNMPPVITFNATSSANVATTTLTTAETLTIEALAVDPEGKSVTAAWSAENGTLSDYAPPASIRALSGTVNRFYKRFTPTQTGTGKVTVVITDADGKSATGTLSITIGQPADSSAPTAAITYAPAGPYKSGTSVTITATFNEAMKDDPAPKIAISGENTLAATAMTKTSATVYTYTHVVGAGDGNATVALSNGTDLAGNAVTAAPTSGATFIVDNTAPTIANSGLSPADNATNVNRAGNLVITFSENVAKGTGDIVVKKVSDNSPFETIAVTDAKITVSNTQVTIDPVGTLAAGTQYYVEIAATCFTDAAGNAFAGITGNATWRITTAPDPDPNAPTAAITYSPAGPYKAGTSVTITATFNESMKDDPAPKIAISGANTLAATAMTKTSATVYTYTHVVGAGDGNATVALSNGTDLAGNTITAAPTSGATFVVDNTAPTLLSTSPAAFATNVPINTNIVFTFSEEVFKNDDAVITVGGISVPVTDSSVTVSGNQLIFNPTNDFTYDSLYLVLIMDSPVVDAAGNALSVAPFSFTTAAPPDSVAPVAAVTYSAVGPYKQGTSVTITATFNEAMKDDPAPKIAISGANTLAATAMTKTSATVYTYNYTVGAGNGDATITLSNGTDLAGNVITAEPISGASFVVDNTQPRAEITYFPEGPFKEGTNVIITATFDEDMKDPAPLLAIGGISTTGYLPMTRTGPRVFSINYVAPLGDGNGTITLANGSDLAGNTVNSTPTSGATFAVDNTWYSWDSVTPAAGATNVPTSTNIVFTSDENVRKNTGVVELRNLSGGSNIIIDVNSSDVSVNGKVVTITPPAGLESLKNYQILCDHSVFLDLAGNRGFFINQSFTTQ